MTIPFKKWPKIGQFHNVRKSVRARKEYHEAERLEPYQVPIHTYRAKIKLDGTNAAIRVDSEGNYVAQSRTRVITPEDDNQGFAKWASENEDWITELRPIENSILTLFGEWCGSGIMKRCAISKIDSKIFAVFAVHFEYPGDEPNSLIVDPDAIAVLLEDANAYALPWFGHEITIPWDDDESFVIGHINCAVKSVEGCDPWVKETFGVEGLGEGLVYYPLASDSLEMVENWAFKAKGEKHSVVKQKKPVEKDPEIVASVEAFVDKFVTTNRMEQALAEACDGKADMTSTGRFLKWMGKDIKTEGADELEASGLTWKDVSKDVQAKAREWWMAKCKE